MNYLSGITSDERGDETEGNRERWEEKMLILFISVVFYNNKVSILYKQKIHILTNCTRGAKRLERER